VPTSCRVLLAKKAAEIFEEDEAVEASCLLKHGIFSFGDSAEEAYERMIAAVTLAEERLKRGPGNVFAPAALPGKICERDGGGAAPCAGACALSDPAVPGAYKRFVPISARPAVLNLVNGAEIGVTAGPGSPLPTTPSAQNHPLIVLAPKAGKLDEIRCGGARRRLNAFAADYHDYFARNNAAVAASSASSSRRRVICAGLVSTARAQRQGCGGRADSPNLGRDRDRRRSGRHFESLPRPSCSI